MNKYISFESVACRQGERMCIVDCGLNQGTRLKEAKRVWPRACLNFPAAFISYCTTKKIKWLIFFVNVMKSTVWLLCSILYFYLAAK